MSFFKVFIVFFLKKKSFFMFFFLRFCVHAFVRSCVSCVQVFFFWVRRRGCAFLRFCVFCQRNSMFLTPLSIVSIRIVVLK